MKNDIPYYTRIRILAFVFCMWGFYLIANQKNNIELWQGVLLSANGSAFFLFHFYGKIKTRQTKKLFKVLRLKGRLTLKEIEDEIRYKRDKILRLLPSVNLLPKAHFHFLSKTDEIVDADLMVDYLVDLKCDNCGQHSVKKFQIHSKIEVTCDYCGSVLDGSDWQERQWRAHQEVLAKAQKDYTWILYVLGVIAYILMVLAK